MTNFTLADDYLKRAKIRLKALYTLRDEGGYADVVRESQELVELVLKAVLRKIAIEPPHWHEVSPLLIEHREKLTLTQQGNLDRVILLSKKLRKERELSYYGDDDYIPSLEYTLIQAEEFVAECEWILDWANVPK